MKVPIKKAIYRDVIERTRGLRIGFLLASAVLTYVAYRIACEDMPVIARVSVWPIVFLVIAFAFFQEIRIHAFHRKKKWEWFHTIPFSKEEWYWTSRLAEITNLVIMIVVMTLEECLACFIMMKKCHCLQIGMPFVRQAFYAFAAGLLFMGLMSVIRELTHSMAAFVGLILMTLAAGYLSLEMVEVFTENFTNGFGDLPLYWPTRFCLTERVFIGLDLDAIGDIALVYDTLAIIVAILVACGLMLLGRKFAASSRYEYIGAEGRNKKLFVIFVSLSLILAFHIFTLIVASAGFTVYIFLFLLLFLLIIVLFCRLLKERSIRRIAGCFLIAAIFVALLVGFSGLTALSGRRLPKKENVIAIEQSNTLFTKPEAVTKAYDEIVAEKKRRAGGGEKAARTIQYTVYTKFGRRTYDVPETEANGLIIRTETGAESYREEFRYEATQAAVLRYGTKPVWIGQISTREYKEIISRIPDAYKKEIPVYRVNTFGGLSRCKDTIVTLPDSFPESGGYEVVVSLENSYPVNYESVSFLFPDEPELMRYYIEEIQAPKWERIRKTIKSAFYCQITLTFDAEFRSKEDVDSACLKRRIIWCEGKVGKGFVSSGYVRGMTKKTKMSSELTDEVMEMLNLSGEITYAGGEYVLAVLWVYGYTEDPNGALYELDAESILLALPKDRVASIFDRFGNEIPKEEE